MKKLLILIAFVMVMGSPAYAQEALPGDDPGINSATESSAPTPGTTAAQQVQQPSSTGGATKSSGFVALAPIEGLTKGITANTTGLANFLNNLYKYLIGLAAVLAIIMIIWGGLEYSTQDSVSKKSDGKERIIQAILGLILVLSPVLVFSIINPAILNLSINLQPLDTAPGIAPATQQRQLPTCSNMIKTNCIPGAQAAFDEGYYLKPPAGSYCFKFDLTTIEGAVAAGGKNITATPTPYYCAKNLTGVAQSCRVALVSYCPTSANVSSDGTALTGSCPGLATACAPY